MAGHKGMAHAHGSLNRVALSALAARQVEEP